MVATNNNITTGSNSTVTAAITTATSVTSRSSPVGVKLAEKENMGWNFSPDPKSPPPKSQNGNSSGVGGGVGSGRGGGGPTLKNGENAAPGENKKFDQYRQQAEQKRKREEILKSKETSNRSRSSSPTGTSQGLKAEIYLLFHRVKIIKTNFKISFFIRL